MTLLPMASVARKTMCPSFKRRWNRRSTTRSYTAAADSTCHTYSPERPGATPSLHTAIAGGLIYTVIIPAAIAATFLSKKTKFAPCEARRVQLRVDGQRPQQRAEPVVDDPANDLRDAGPPGTLSGQLSGHIKYTGPKGHKSLFFCVCGQDR